MKKGTEKEDLRRLILKLEKAGRKEKCQLWVTAAELLALPRRRMVQVNVGKIEKLSADGQVALVPGKLLGDGIIEKKLSIAAYECTPGAKKKVEAAGGVVMPIEELFAKNPKGTGILLVR